jgi:DNA invertase Pin-like site-specific DNA recombinase
MIAVYIRVSDKRQKLDSQRAEIQKWLDANAIDASQVEWFEDKRTGKTLDRPAFDELQKAIFNGRVKSVVLWKLDRLSRRLKDGITTLADWCERDVRVVVTTMQLDLKGAVGKLVAGILLGLAEVELEFRRERQAAGIEVAKKRGVYRGRAKGTHKGSPERAKELRAKGLRLDEIGAAMEVSARTVARYLNGAS